MVFLIKIWKLILIIYSNLWKLIIIIYGNLWKFESKPIIKTKILIIKRDKIGDLLLVTPMLTHLRQSFPTATIDFLCNDYNSFVLKNNKDIDNLFIYYRTKHNGKIRPFCFLHDFFYISIKLILKKYDFIILAGGVYNYRSLMRAVWLCGKRTIGTISNNTNIISGLTDPIIHQSNLHEVESNYLLLKPLGIDPPITKINPTFVIKPLWMEYAKHWLHEKNIDDFIVIGINSRRNKRKPTDNQILGWSKIIYEKYKVKTVFMWQPGDWNNKLYPGDNERLLLFLNNLPFYIVPSNSDINIFHAISIIQYAKVTVLPDGGMAHLASCSKGGVISLFCQGPSPINWRPYTNHSQYLYAAKSVEEDISNELIVSKISSYLY